MSYNVSIREGSHHHHCDDWTSGGPKKEAEAQQVIHYRDGYTLVANT